MMTVFGKRCDEREWNEPQGLVREGYDLLGMFNWIDHFPLLGLLDLQGARKRCRKLVQRMNLFVGKLITEHKMRWIENGKGTNGGDDHNSSRNFVDVLLDLDAENRLNDSDMIAVLWDMIFKGTDTVAILLEWALARMVLHPEIQAKARAEIDTVVGTTKSVTNQKRVPFHRTFKPIDPVRDRKKHA
ncbi:hypothetical protein Ancab_024250 [Ancistrocladus abbreviatus]